MFGLYFGALDFRFWLNGMVQQVSIASIVVRFAARSGLASGAAGTAAGDAVAGKGTVRARAVR